MTDLLLPCPFCGSNRVGMASSIEATEWGVLCSDCGSSCSTSCETHADAVAAWNLRTGGVAQTSPVTPDDCPWEVPFCPKCGSAEGCDKVRAQAVPDCGAGFMTADEWPKEIDERVLLYVVHQNAQYESDETKRVTDWEGWCVGSWTDFNGGGWTWHGMIGTVTHVAPLLPPPGSQLPSTDRGTP